MFPGLLLGLLLFAVSVAYLPGVVSVTTAGRWAVLAVGAALLIWTVRVTWTLGHVLGAAFLTWCALSLLWSASPWDGLGFLVQYAILGALFLVAAQTDDLSPVLTALGYGALVSAIVIVLQAMGLRPVAFIDKDNALVGLFLTKSAAAEFGVITLVACLAVRAWYLVPSAIVLAVAPMSRVSLAVLTMLGLAWCALRLKKQWTAVIVGMIVVSVAVIVKVIGFDPSSLNERLEIWQVTLFNLTWTGYGLGSYTELLPYYQFAHSAPLQLLFELGVGAFLLFGVIGRAFKSAAVYQASAPVWVMAAVCLQAAASFSLYEPAVVAVFAVVAGHLCGLPARNRGFEPVVRSLGTIRVRDAGYDGAATSELADVSRNDLPAGPQSAAGTASLRSVV